jgi:membrane fusion protein, multidrug efflux system
VDKDGKAESRPVVVGEWDGNEWFVFEGLKSGERVVVDGALMLSPGMPLTVKPSSQSPGNSAPAGDQKTSPAMTGEKKK